MITSLPRRLVLALALIAPLARAADISPGTLLQFDFNAETSWPLTAPKPDAPGVTAGAFGTIDTLGGTTPSGGLRLVMETTTRDPWTARLTSGPLSVSNPETDLAKLTFAFSLSVTRALPVRVRIESFDTAKERTGGLVRTINPAAADFHQRYALDLSTFAPEGTGAFDPAAPFVAFTLETGTGTGWPALTRHELHFDNLHYARPGLHVSPQGDDTRDDRTAATALATPQRAVEIARPGDIILLMDGTYRRPADREKQEAAITLPHSGSPAAWITLQNHPGHRPVSSHGRVGIRIFRSRNAEDKTLGYLEVCGLVVRGNGDTAKTEFPDEIGRATPNTDSRGFFIFGRGSFVHHIRIADNTVEYNTSDGIYIDSVDWISVENNAALNNCWTTIGYAPAGLTVMKYANFDGVDNTTKFLISGNTVAGNKLTVMNSPWGAEKKTGFFNGNGILIDANAENPPEVYAGRTLVQNNLVFNNGGGGIQLWGNHRIDLLHNTVVRNGTVNAWGEVGFERNIDVRFLNNLVVAGPHNALDSWYPHQPDKRTERILRANNLFWGGAKPPIEGIDDLVAEPLFVNPATDPASADYRLRPGSPGLGAGRWEPDGGAADFAGRPRPARGAPEIGAFQN
jgi:parallel beta-helix repeat protein